MLFINIKCRFVVDFVYDALVIRLRYDELFTEGLKAEIVIVRKMQFISAKSNRHNRSVIYAISDKDERFVVAHTLRSGKRTEHHELAIQLVYTIDKRFWTKAEIR